VAWLLKASREGLYRLACRTQLTTVIVSKNGLGVGVSNRARTLIDVASRSFTILGSSLSGVKRIYCQISFFS
jgi:hypothetical protein